MVPEFSNEPLTDFSNPSNRQAMDGALRQVKGEFGREWPLVIAGQPVTNGAWIDSLDPCHKTAIGGRVARAAAADAERALEAAWEMYAEWSVWDPAHRARMLPKAALMRRHKHLLSATMVYGPAGHPGPRQRPTPLRPSPSSSTTVAKRCD
jgi:1-pyrroline-5-carboxylate dehydrogenase